MVNRLIAKSGDKRVEIFLTVAGLLLVGYIAYLSGENHLYAVGFILIPAILLVIFFPLPLFLIFVASFPFNVIPIAEQVGFSLPRAIGYLLFLSWALYIFRENRADLVKVDRISLNFFVFLAWGLITIIWSGVPLWSLQIGFTLLQLWGFYFIAMSLIDNKNKLKLVIYAVLISYTFVAISSIIRSTTQLRAVGVTGSDQNEFAALMVLPIYLSLNLAIYYKKFWLKLLFGLIMVILMLGATSTVSRGFLVAILISFLYRIFIDVNKKRAIAAVLLVVTLTGLYFIPRYIKREKIEPSIYVKELPSGRMAIWIVGFEIIKKSPIFGNGMGTFRSAFDDAYQENRYKTGFVGYQRVAHNDFITIMAEYGLVGFLIWLGMMIYVFRESYRLNVFFLRAGDEYLYTIANAVACSLVALLLCQAFLGLYLQKFFWLAIAFVPILKGMAGRLYGAKDELLA